MGVEFDKPGENSILWRYIDLAKFVDLLHTKSLFLSIPSRFGDPLEASLVFPRNLRSGSTQKMGVPPTDLREYTSDAYRYAVSCWHHSNHESVAMWKLYMPLGMGVAIKTTPRRLRQATSGVLGDAWRVKYIDFEKVTNAIPMRDALLCKRMEFAYEKEVRCLKELDQKDQDWFRFVGQVRAKMGVPAGLPVPAATSADGVWVDTDPEILVKEVVVNPDSPDWVVSVVRALVAKFDYRRLLVRRSTT